MALEQRRLNREPAGPIQRYVDRGLLPEPIRLSPQKRLWRESDIQKFLDRLGRGAAS